MTCACPDDFAPPEPTDGAAQGRAACLALLDAVLAHRPGGVRGSALFLLDCCGPRLNDSVLAEVERRLRAASPGWHRLLRGDAGEFAVIVQGLVDGGAVLGAAARLVHAFDDALQTSDLPLSPDVAIGIAFATQHGTRAETMLTAAESSLRESRAASRLGRRGTLPSIPPLGSFDQ